MNALYLMEFIGLEFIGIFVGIEFIGISIGISIGIEFIGKAFILIKGHFITDINGIFEGSIIFKIFYYENRVWSIKDAEYFRLVKT